MYNKFIFSTLSVLLFLLIDPCVFAQKKEIMVIGRVFTDKNANGIFDKGEKRIRDVFVSNGVDIVRVDRNGKFSLHATSGQSIFPIMPSGYVFANSALRIGNAHFLYLDPSTLHPDTLVFDFGLQVQKQSESFRVGAIGDVQVDNEEELGYAAKSIMKELAQREDLAFNMILGDLVNNNMALIPAFKNLLQQVPTASWTLVGNHDRNTDNSDAMDDVFNRHFGADTYAFNYGGVHFIVLNNVYSTGKNSYEGRISEDQLRFLENDLRHLSKGTTIVLSQHIPMAHTRNRKDVLALLDGYEKVLLLSGHTHTVNRYFFNSPHIHELGAGATCGHWWRGEKDRDGVPDALMQCGTPRGYFVLDFDSDGYHIRYKGVGLDPDKQMSLQVDSSRLVANIYGGSDSTDAWIQIDSLPWVKMEKSRRVDLSVQHVIANNKAKIYPTDGSTRNPLGQRKSSHIWEADRPSGLDICIHAVRISVEDRYGYKVSEEFFVEM